MLNDTKSAVNAGEGEVGSSNNSSSNYLAIEIDSNQIEAASSSETINVLNISNSSNSEEENESPQTTVSLPVSPILYPNTANLKYSTRIKFQLDNLKQHSAPIINPSEEKYSDYFSKPKSNIFSTTPNRLSIGSKDRLQFNSLALKSYISKQKLIIEISKSFIKFGFPSHRIEEYMKNLAISLRIEASFIILPTNLMMIVFGDNSTHLSETKFVKILASPEPELWKLKQALIIGERVLNKDIKIEEANTKLGELLQSKPLYYPFIIVLFNGLYAFSSCLIYFRGSWKDGVTTLLLGWLVGLLNYVSSEWLGYSNLFELTTVILCSVLSALVHGKSCYFNTLPPALYPLLPGLTTVLAFVDLVFKNQICGVIKTVKAIIISFVLSFGLLLGTKIFNEFMPNLTYELQNDDICLQSVGNWGYFLVPVMLLSSFVLLQAHYSQFPMMLFTSLISFLTFELGKHYSVSAELLCVLAAFQVGLVSNLVGKLRLEAPFPYLLSGYLIIVQAYFGNLGPSSILGEIGVFGGTIVIYILLVSMTICVGLFASSLCLYWFRTEKASLCSL
ncbi:hypothetical protein CONCODRAFT_61175 [Conidiobolus coronatus NRRL 28638]|uniref:Threonine/serine exporter-like N-terminal domain-containing protein n=1 Tax=Conidiobolus coronatus (strain ATCC 28846 / CBS 209.66 / NRRL 28638) TaxID=796925 RepID=A0A137NX06_CONC2|nr:hypothetical protein CONCODRAFT_61175 [Conidiobolus coronatus NRRL 28638]|eukprot:KXN67257.1 hypothetical protein CONCODRAFT_61175 [Conidiobolus coronatus NRRL 28638]